MKATNTSTFARQTAAVARRLALLLCLALGASATPLPTPDAVASPPARPTANLAARTAPFAVARPRPATKRKVHGKPLLAVRNTQELSAYTREFGTDTIEVLFTPGASEYGHLEIRVGDRVFDMPGPWGARQMPFSQRYLGGRTAYGFLFHVGTQRVTELLAAYRDLLRTNPSFSISGTGYLNCYSCAGFVTAVLDTAAGDLGIPVTASAIGSASDMLSSGAYDAVALYGNAAATAESSNFRFDRIE